MEFEVSMNLEIKRVLLLLFSFCCSLSDMSYIIATELSGSVPTNIFIVGKYAIPFHPKKKKKMKIKGPVNSLISKIQQCCSV